MGADNVLFTVNVDAKSGKAELQTFEKVVESTANKLVVHTERMTDGMGKTEQATQAAALGFGDLKDKFLGLTVAGIGVYEAFGFLKSAVEGVAEDEKTLLRLSMTLDQTGAGGMEAARAIDEYAYSLMRQTGVSHDAIMEASALIAALARVRGEGLERATRAAVELSDALNIDLQTAAQAVGKGGAGMETALRRVGIAFQATGDAERDVEGITSLVLSRFGAVSERIGGTLPGQLRAMKSEWEEVRDAIGGAVVALKQFNDWAFEVEERRAQVALDQESMALNDPNYWIKRTPLFPWMRANKPEIDFALQWRSDVMGKIGDGTLAGSVLAELGAGDRIKQAILDIAEARRAGLISDADAEASQEKLREQLAQVTGDTQRAKDAAEAYAKILSDMAALNKGPIDRAKVGTAFTAPGFAPGDLKFGPENRNQLFDVVQLENVTAKMNDLRDAVAAFGKTNATLNASLKETARELLHLQDLGAPVSKGMVEYAKTVLFTVEMQERLVGAIEASISAFGQYLVSQARAAFSNKATWAEALHEMAAALAEQMFALSLTELMLGTLASIPYIGAFFGGPAAAAAHFGAAAGLAIVGGVWAAIAAVTPSSGGGGATAGAYHGGSGGPGRGNATRQQIVNVYLQGQGFIQDTASFARSLKTEMERQSRKAGTIGVVSYG